MNKPLTFEQWSKDPVRRARLTAILEDETFIEAVETLTTAFAPTVPSVLVSGIAGQAIPVAADLNNLLALRYTQHAAFFGFQNALKNLTRERAPRKPIQQPWGGTLVPDGAELPATVPATKPKQK